MKNICYMEFLQIYLEILLKTSQAKPTHRLYSNHRQATGINNMSYRGKENSTLSTTI